MSIAPVCTRRRFLAQTAGLATVMAAGLPVGAADVAAAPPLARCPIASFSKVFQELELDFDASAEVAAAVGFDGIDCPVRPGGQVLPERAADDMPKYAEALARRKLKLLLLTTAVLSPKTPHAEVVLRTAKRLGVTHYRLGYWNYKDFPSRAKLLAEARAQLKDLAGLNRELGLCGVYQNHSGRDNFGATISDLREVIQDFDPAQLGVAFDPSHAVIELGDSWREELERLRRHVVVAYVKDMRRGQGFVKFGEGELGGSGWFTWLKQARYSLPLSMHTEYEWVPKGNHKTRDRLVAALTSDLAQLRRWIGAA